MTTYWHITGPDYTLGSDLLSWDRLVASGVSTEWKWDDAPEGYDGHLVCMFRDTPQERQERDWFRGEIAGAQVLRITIPDEDVEDGTVTLAEVAEGYIAVLDTIPAHYITIDKE